MASNLHTLLKRDKEKSINARYVALKEYNEAYKKIYTPKLVRLLSNTYNTFLTYLMLALAILFSGIFVTTLFPQNYVLPVLKQFDIKPDANEMEGYMAIVRIAGIGPLILGLLFLWIGMQVRKIQIRNRTIANLSTLLNKVITEEKNNIDREKEAYFQLLDIIDKDKNKPEGV
jgi:hypothetical protein